MSKPKLIKYLDVNSKDLKVVSNKNLSIGVLKEKMKNILDEKIHGISFSPYLEGQDPSLFSEISDIQISTRLEVIQPYTNWIRTFSCSKGNQTIPRIAKEMGFKTLVGCWIGIDKAVNEEEFENMIKIAKEGYADIVAIGNEVLLREDLTPKELLSYISRAKKALPDVQIGYVDAYYTFVNYPEITEACDVILANCYPFWERCNLDYSIDYMKNMYKFVQTVASSKK